MVDIDSSDTMPLSSMLEEFVTATLDLNCNVVKDMTQDTKSVPIIDICSSDDDDSGLELSSCKETNHQISDVDISSPAKETTPQYSPLPHNVLASELSLSTSTESYIDLELSKTEELEILQESKFACADSLSSLDSGFTVPSPETEAILLHESEQLKPYELSSGSISTYASFLDHNKYSIGTLDSKDLGTCSAPTAHVPSPPPACQLLEKAGEQYPPEVTLLLGESLDDEVQIEKIVTAQNYETMVKSAVPFQVTTDPAESAEDLSFSTGDFILDEVLPLLLEAEAACSVDTDAVIEDHSVDTDPVKEDHSVDTDPVKAHHSVDTGLVTEDCSVDADQVIEDHSVDTDPVKEDHSVDTDQVIEDHSVDTDPVKAHHSVDTGLVTEDCSVDADPVTVDHSVNSDLIIEDHSAPASAHTSADTFQDGTQPKPSWAVPWISTDDAENADNNDPEWDVMRKLETDEERYRVVRQQWRQMTIPDPRRNLTSHNFKRTSSRPGTSNNFKSVDNRGQSRKRARSPDDCSDVDHPSKRRRTYSCIQMFENKINNLHQQLNKDLEGVHAEHERKLFALSDRQQQQQQSLINSTAPYHIIRRRIDDLAYRQEREVDGLQAEFNREVHLVKRDVMDTIKILQNASQEVLAFNRFYTDLGDSHDNDHCNISEEELQQFEETEQMFEAFDQIYTG